MKKLICLILLVSVILTSQAGFAAPIHRYEEVIPISKSITLTKVREFYANHNISYSYIKADLNDENISLKLLKSDKGADILETVPNLANTQKDTVAAMNADFFSVHSGNKGFSLGIEVKDGGMLASPINPDTMATVSSLNNTLAMNYLSYWVAVVAPNGNYETVRHINKHTAYYGDILMYTPDFNGGYSPAPGGEVVEVVVSGGKIVEFRRKMPSVKIPDDGCVLVVSEGVNMFLANNMTVGDEVRFDYYITPDVQKSDIAFGGGAMLVQDGKAVSDFSHVVSGYNPRSAIGMSSDGKQMWLVAVDGRQTQSRGMTMSELANLMKELGCHNAVNLDGGGSTNMVASTIWNKDLTKVNSPTENRKVINAVGLGYAESGGTAFGISLKPDKDVIFIGDSVNIASSVYDENMRPADGTVTLAADSGSINGNVFTATSGGKVTITATSGNAKGSAEIYVADKISGIDVLSHMTLKKGESKSFDINVFDNEGHYVKASDISPFKITSSDNAVARAEGNKITGLSDGTATIKIEKDGAASYISVAVGGKSYSYTETFEYEEGYFNAYPKDVPGSFNLSTDNAYAGNRSGYLSYDFTGEDNTTKAVYYTLNNKKTLSDTNGTVELYFMSETDFTHDIRSQFTDAKGNVLRAVMGRDLEGGKWHRLSCKVPDDAVLPVTLDRIYAVYVDGEAKDAGGIYIDNLTYEMTEAIGHQAAPQNVYSGIATAGGTLGTARIGAVVKNPQTLLAGLTNSAISRIVGSSGSNALIGALRPFATREDANALYISINTSKGGIRSTDSSQWNSIANAIYQTKMKNVFILSDNDLFGSDEFENGVIKDYLSALDKNIFVITGGNSNTYKNIGGVKFFTICNTEKDELSQAKMDNYRYLEFSFGDEVTFEWKKVF